MAYQPLWNVSCQSHPRRRIKQRNQTINLHLNYKIYCIHIVAVIHNDIDASI